MIYMGSKRRLAKSILPLMLDGHGDRLWVEPFVGGGNLIDKVTGDRLGADANPWVIQALESLRDSAPLLPRNNLEFTEQDYRALNTDLSYPYRGFAGFAYSYGGKWLGGWARNGARGDDYVKQAYNSAQRQQEGLKGLVLTCSPYETLPIPRASTIYCDPPYRGSTGYSKHINHEHFWQWCRQQTANGHRVFISEYSAPKDALCVWEKEVYSDLTGGNGTRKKIERLFTFTALVH